MVWLLFLYYLNHFHIQLLKLQRSDCNFLLIVLLCTTWALLNLEYLIKLLFNRNCTISFVLIVLIRTRKNKKINQKVVLICPRRILQRRTTSFNVRKKHFALFPLSPPTYAHLVHERNTTVILGRLLAKVLVQINTFLILLLFSFLTSRPRKSLQRTIYIKRGNPINGFY